MDYKFHHNISLSEICEVSNVANKYYHSTGRRIWYSLILCTVPLGIILIFSQLLKSILLYLKRSNIVIDNLMLMIIGLVFFIIVLGLIFKFIFPPVVKFVNDLGAKDLNIEPCPTDFKFCNEGIRMQCEDYETFVKWSSVKAVMVTRDKILFLYNFYALWVPTHAIGDAGTLKNFLEDIQSNVPEVIFK